MTESENAAPEPEVREPWSAPSGGLPPPGPVEGLRRLALAGIGALAVATEVTDSVFTDLVKRGEQTRDEVMRELKEARERRNERRTDATTYVRARMDTVLNRLNLPSKGDVDSISAKLNILTRKVDDVQAGHVDPATGVYRSATQDATEPTEQPPV